MENAGPSLPFGFSVLFGGCFALILAAGLLIQPKKNAGAWLGALFLASLSAWQIPDGIVAIGFVEGVGPELSAISITAYCAAISLAYLCFRWLLDDSFRLRSIDIRHAGLPLVTAAAALPLVVNGPMRPGATFGESMGPALSIILCGASALCVLYFTDLLIRMLRLLKGAEGRDWAALVPKSILMSLIFALMIAFSLDRLFSLGLATYLHIGCSLVLVFAFLFGIRYPAYRFVPGSESERRYAHPRLKEETAAEAQKRLEAVMREGKAYLDPKLSLASLAERVGIDAHGLSELINTRLKASFLEYVADCRVEEAKRILHDDPGRKIIDIAFDVGFNSLSAFYAAFKRATGASPKQFLKRKSIPNVKWRGQGS